MSKISIGQMAVIAGAAGAILIFFMYGGPTLGFPESFQSDYIALIPGLVVFASGALMIVTVRGVLLIPGFAALGMGIAVLIQEMNTISLLIPTLVSADFTLAQMQLTIIVMSFIIGAVFAAATRR